jgi:hypothetical protein
MVSQFNQQVQEKRLKRIKNAEK